MESLILTRLLGFAKGLQQASTFAELLELTRTEVERATGYRHAWLFVSDSDDVEEVRLLDAAGSLRERTWEVAPVLKIRGDAMLEQIVHGDAAVVVLDARTDPRTDKRIVGELGNRTIVNVPLRLLDKPFGAFGVGTFGDEGCRAPNAAELDYLIGMAGQLSVAAVRIRLADEQSRARREKDELERCIQQMQRLESVGLLAGGVAHDFNNLLTIIVAGVSMFRNAHPEGSAHIDLIADAAERGCALTRKLLAMSREQPLDLRLLDVNDRLRELHGLLQRVFLQNIDLDFVHGARLPLVLGDATQLDQVFMNICINARDAMPNGGSLAVRTEQVVVNGALVNQYPWLSRGSHVLVTIADTGIGMPGEIVERVFEPFFTAKEGGTGLGLAIAHGIVRQHGGTIGCESELGRGTTFKVYLPASGDTLVVTSRADPHTTPAPL